MIAIIGKDGLDPSTEDVIEWIEYYKRDWIRINGVDFIENGIDINQNDKLDNIDIVWFRRLLNEDIFEDLFDNGNISNNNSIRLNYFLKREIDSIIQYSISRLLKKKWLSHPTELKADKLQALKLAKKNNISFPQTIITSSKKELIAFKLKYKRIITKTITDVTLLINDEQILKLTTQEVDDDFIDNLNDNFFPSLFQELIEKEFEIRTFYLDGRFYSMAIFSQLDVTTKIDFRNYNHVNPNRTIPYKLPQEYENQLRKLMTDLNLSTASLDIIKSTDNKYVFLEYNPVGQFSMVSYPCNYYLEQEIASFLSKNDD